MSKKHTDALKYHSEGRPGKIEVIPTKPYRTQRDLALAYSPGVAEPCLEIEKDPENSYKYTAKGNLVAVISNGTAVLGLGNIGALAGKPVMEGKGLLFKIFADIDVFDIEVDATDVDKFVETVKAIAPTFGGINLEDIKAPECFEIEQRLKDELDIPVMHDDQHGTAIISAAGLLNALEINGKKIEDISVVVNGAGAAAVSCTKLYISLGVKPENIIMCDSRGVVNKKRTDLNSQKKQFITERNIDTLEQALVGADVFLGLSIGGIVNKKMVSSMADKPVVFALANPDPEIDYNEAIESKEGVIVATGRSDYPNQINNVLGFPYIFRGALDVRASTINEEMKIASVHAIAKLAKEPVPESVHAAYNESNIIFGRHYIIPKAMDPRLVSSVAVAVAKAAVESGVARKIITDWDAYSEELKQRLGTENELIRTIFDKAKCNPKRVVFAEGNNFNVLKAAQIVLHDGIAKPIILGNPENIQRIVLENELDLNGAEIIDIRSQAEAGRRNHYANVLCEKRGRKGLTLKEAVEKMFDRNYFGAMMVENGDADAFISGYATRYFEALKVASKVIGIEEGMKTLVGMNIIMTKKGPLFFADTTVNAEPTSDSLVDTTLSTARALKTFNIEPVMAMVSYSNFGSVRKGSPVKVNKAISKLHTNNPDLLIDGEMQLNFALDKNLRDQTFGFTKIKGKDVNTIIFPNLSSGNIAYKLMKDLDGSENIGPILLGTAKPFHIIPMGCSVREIINMTAIAVVDAQS
ncbi:NADP-dependent malic enzyme [Labilibaculum euxinus]|uniref:NADP-dependent malic enzyme n=1 Tax=Labilibaculum euxinus TaxID=2686357 RepID=A0A7M4D5Q0_9BACT|nr:NADP-dependent malic enzyme [Labilibaculum euxinus]MUP37979.1 NADP-dependent malic enzyme [Labilibaculum euxinus]MVB07184.1 NADP-dependent malic enzyme [Labilibaculum euxinus]